MFICPGHMSSGRAYLCRAWIKLSVIATILISGCIDNTYKAPATSCEEDSLKANTTFAGIRELYKDEVIRITEDLIIEGYVISNDKTGNFYGTLHLQDQPEHPKEGFQVDIDVRDYHLLYPVGKKVLIRLKGMYLGKSRGVFKAGGVFTNAGGTLSVGRLPASQVNEHIFVSCDEPGEIVPEMTTIEALNDEMINTLIQLNNMEISPEDMCQPYAVAGENGTDRVLRDCNEQEIILRNSGYADFQPEILPRGNGTVTAVLGKYNNKYQLIIRDTNDIKLNDGRCGGVVYSCNPPGANATLGYVRAMYQGKAVNISENIKVRATVISDRNFKNTDSLTAVIQDKTSGIVCEFTSEHALDLGDEVELTLLNTTLEEINDLLYIKNIPPENIISAVPGTLPEPESISLSDSLNVYESRLVTIGNIQFETPGVTYSGIQTLTDCTDELKMFTREEAVFAGDTVSSKKGSITGIISKNKNEYHLRIRNPDDIYFTEDYEDCLGGTNLMITEYAEGSGYNKYIEIYNAADVNIDMSGYVLGRDYDGDGNYEYTLNLSGNIAPGEIAVYAHSRAEIFQGEITDTHGSALGFNGNDQVVLMKNNNIIDHMGIPGGENWGVDKTLRRKTDISVPNISYNENEWEEYPQDNISGLGIR
ncbi:DUF5689 domain-containing protein [Sinomicrobium weinanense]|nr:DUF5689 domain-containing protein [Sinomicrobium weinanense]MBU3123995.1 lamin tail domain-containing protein [Sinomicrobium weinanense]